MMGSTLDKVTQIFQTIFAWGCPPPIVLYLLVSCAMKHADKKCIVLPENLTGQQNLVLDIA
jgi:hypothetical protein